MSPSGEMSTVALVAKLKTCQPEDLPYLELWPPDLILQSVAIGMELNINVVVTTAGEDPSSAAPVV